MSIPGRLWRLLRTEFNHLSGRFVTGAKDRYRDVYEAYREGVGEEYVYPEGQDPELAAHYRALELPYGADLAAVRAAYKQQMKRYHPDRFQDASKKVTATELVKKLNEAYSALTAHLS